MQWIPKVKKVITIEENVLAGGFGSAVLETINTISPNNTNKIQRIGLDDNFINKYGSQEELFSITKLTEENIIKKLKK